MDETVVENIIMVPEKEDDVDDFMLGREPTMFPSMPVSEAGSLTELVQLEEPLNLNQIRVEKTSLDESSIRNEVFGVGFSESPTKERDSKRNTFIWNVNDIPVL